MTTRREFLGSVPAAGAAFAVSGRFLLDGEPAHAQATTPPAGHSHPKGKAPSISVNGTPTRTKSANP